MSGGRRDNAGRKQQWFKLTEDDAYTLAQIAAAWNSTHHRPNEAGTWTPERVLSTLIADALKGVNQRSSSSMPDW